jgi:hypothetical protein
MNGQRIVNSMFVCLLFQAVPALSQDAILPQGDPRLRDDPQQAEQREAARDSRMKQQGQGPDYRVEGKRQGGTNGETAGEANGPTRQDTGLADPSVNPGQASGMRVLHGEVKQASPKSIVIEDRHGKETTMSIDAVTAGDRDIRPGDVITGTVTTQGRAVAIHKETAPER